MIKKIKKFFIRFLFLKIYLLLIKKSFKINSFDYNFQNIEFNDEIYLKKILFSNKYFKGKFYGEQSYSYHSFDWLNIAKKIGGASNVVKSKNQLIIWKKNKYKINSFVWNSFFISKRFINIIYNYDFFAITSSKIDKNMIHDMVLKHYILLDLDINSKDFKLISLEECKAILLGSLIYKRKNSHYISLLKKILSFQIDNNGFHKSYNPSKQAEYINHLFEIKNILLFFNQTIPDLLNFQILNMSSLLISLIHTDGSLALFNGSNNFHIEKVFQLIKKESDLKQKNLKKIKQGIISYADKNKKIYMDIFRPKNNPINNNFHAGTLSFELSCLNEKIITNCGAINKKFGEGPEYLRFSAAHSTIILNNTNISELVKNKSYKRAPKNISLNSFEDDENLIWESSHDGYLKNFHKIIKRKLTISKKTNSILGKDEIISTKANSKKNNYSIRFHLMPDCNCLITNNKKSVLIKTKLNQSWIFKSSSLSIIEDSIYIGGGKRVEQNQQIVIYGNIQNRKKIENWSLTKS